MGTYDDRPVPLVPDQPPGAATDPDLAAAADPISQAERAVRDAREAMVRQETDPTPATAARLAALDRQAFSRRRRAVVLVIAATLAFAHGWHVGASRRGSEGRPDVSAAGTPELANEEAVVAEGGSR